MITPEDPVLTAEQVQEVLERFGPPDDPFTTEAWVEHLSQGLKMTREALLGDLAGECGEEFAKSTRKYLQASNNVFVRATSLPSASDFHSILGEMHAECAAAWKEKEPHESDFVKLAHAISINALPGMALIASILVPGYELRLVKVEQPAAAPAEQAS